MIIVYRDRLYISFDRVLLFNETRVYKFQVTPEQMEAYRMKRIHEDDPMKNLQALE